MEGEETRVSGRHRGQGSFSHGHNKQPRDISQHCLRATPCHQGHTRERLPQAHSTGLAKAQDHISALVRKARAGTSQKVSLVLFQQVAM